MSGMADVYEPGVCPLCGGKDGIHIWAGTGRCPAAPMTQEAELKRLKAENESLIEQFKRIRETCYSKDKLITELCDALEEEYGSCLGDGHPQNLVQRARKATK
jgi:hypothetical protein